MSPAQHTPGWLPPLDPYKGSGRTFTINGVPALLVKRVLAESDRFCPVTPAQADAFARLFAAAPELLAALEETLRALEQHLDDDANAHRLKSRDFLCPCSTNEVVRARAAIAKAKAQEVRQ